MLRNYKIRYIFLLVAHFEKQNFNFVAKIEYFELETKTEPKFNVGYRFFFNRLYQLTKTKYYTNAITSSVVFVTALSSSLLHQGLYVILFF